MDHHVDSDPSRLATVSDEGCRSRLARSSRLAAFLLIFALLWPSAASHASPPEQASKFIADLTSEVVAVLHSEASEATRVTRLRTVLRRGLDLEFMSRFAIGRYWHEATPQQQARYAAVFGDFVVRSYARRLAEQKATGFKITSVREAENGDVVVEETIDRPTAPPANYGFRVRGAGKSFKVIDVSVEGASLLLAQRTDFMLVVQKQGLDGLIHALQQKILDQTGAS